MPVYRLGEFIPVIDPAAYVHPEAVVIGDVIIAADVFVGPGAVLRGDFGRIQLDQGSNLQDTCVMHAFPDKDCVVKKRRAHWAWCHLARLRHWRKLLGWHECGSYG